MRQFTFLTNAGWSDPVGLTRLLTTAGARVVAGRGPFTLTQDGDAVTKPLQRFRILNVLSRRLTGGEIGPVYRIRNPKTVVFSCREVEPALHVLNTNGNAKADMAWTRARLENPHITFLGAYVCKYIAGTATLSQHSYGNALDIGAGQPNTMAVLFAMADWYHGVADQLHLEHIIVGDRIWSRGVGWHNYTGDYHYHVHVDFDPNFSGPCGVRP